MAIRKDKKMLQVSISQEQYKWLDQFCKNRGITKSNYIKWMLCKKAEEMLLLLKIEPENRFTQDELEKIIKYNWLED